MEENNEEEVYLYDNETKKALFGALKYISYKKRNSNTNVVIRSKTIIPSIKLNFLPVIISGLVLLLCIIG